MPGGKPVWHGHLEGQDIDNLYGFYEAHIVCPKTKKNLYYPIGMKRVKRESSQPENSWVCIIAKNFSMRAT